MASNLIELKIEIKGYFRALINMRSLAFLFILGVTSCSVFQGHGTKVLKPKYHKVWAKGNKYLIDIPVGTRHIHLFERRRTRTVTMK
jgi:hypothetical protein